MMSAPPAYRHLKSIMTLCPYSPINTRRRMPLSLCFSVCCNVDRSEAKRSYPFPRDRCRWSWAALQCSGRFLTAKVRCLMCAVAAEGTRQSAAAYNRSVFITALCHLRLRRAPGSACQKVQYCCQSCTTLRIQNHEKSSYVIRPRFFHRMILIAVTKAIDFNVFRAVINHLCHASHRCIQCTDGRRRWSACLFSFIQSPPCPCALCSHHLSRERLYAVFLKK